MIGVVFGDKAFSAAMNSFLPKRIKTELQAAKKYAEGRGIRVTVKSEEDLEVAKLLTEIKAEH